MSDQPCPKEAELTRRSWFVRAINYMGGFIAIVFAGVGGTVFSAPLLRKREADWSDVGDVDGFKIGVPQRVEISKRKRDGWIVAQSRATVWVVRTAESAFEAFDPHCPHLGCPFRWDAQRQKFLCPCHMGVFDKTGAVVEGPPPRPLDRYPTRLVDGRLHVMPVAQKRAGV
ncbi:MAG: hypothetical protein A3G34_15945 [Candidatus Lindowbacteria bacterium RIFCSPLOWO2_12_FULL_62_27]|nr:MAG: hypothetical protein A3I06_12250 [Candidatus Lindowbacteria bacterium RIFCSPLOWO2_02_FULL_62_12]OGH61653.1 MAG: hypothetical protein A3G34_15945 [Candidatus Lindowbacteria bacterium RIFCSPLOWO2_12_FULL_62_27]